MRTIVAAFLVVVTAARAPLGAQAKADTLQHSEKTDAPKVLSFGVSTGMMSFADGGHERGLSAAVGAALPHGFSLSVNPTYAWAQAAPSTDPITGRLVKPSPVQGLADLPVGVSYSHSLSGAWSPGFYVSLGATLPTGDTTTVGSGQTAVGADFGVWVQPTEGWSLSAGAGHSLSNGFATSIGAIAPTSVSLGASHDVGALSLNLGFSTEMGTMPAGTTHSQNFMGGASVPVGPMTLSVDGSAGRADGGRSWAMSIGLGTTLAQVGQVTPFAAAQRLASALGKGRSLGKSRSAAAKAADALRKHKKA